MSFWAVRLVKSLANYLRPANSTRRWTNIANTLPAAFLGLRSHRKKSRKNSATITTIQKPSMCPPLLRLRSLNAICAIRPPRRLNSTGTRYYSPLGESFRSVQNGSPLSVSCAVLSQILSLLRLILHQSLSLVLPELPCNIFQ